MKNLVNLSIEELDEKPRREPVKFHNEDEDVPPTRILRFLTSRIGQPWPKVGQDFTRLHWVPTRFRTLSHLKTYVHTCTYMEGRVIYFSSDCARGLAWSQSVHESFRDLFYLHPKTQVLHFHSGISQRRNTSVTDSWFVLFSPYRQLLKLHGIWYAVWSFEPKVFDRLVKGKAIYRPFPKDLPLLVDRENDPSSTLIMRREALRLASPVYKMQLSHESLKSYGLSNDRPMPVFSWCKICGGKNCSKHRVSTDREEA